MICRRIIILKIWEEILRKFQHRLVGIDTIENAHDLLRQTHVVNLSIFYTLFISGCVGIKMLQNKLHPMLQNVEIVIARC